MVAAAVAGSAFTDAIGIREREQQAGVDRVVAIFAGAELAQIGAFRAAHALEHAALAAAAPQQLQAAADVAVALAAAGAHAAAQQVALGEQCRELRRGRRRTVVARHEQHVREPRVRGESMHRAAVRRDTPFRVEGAEPQQEVARASERRGGRRVKPAQVCRRSAPGGQVEREWRQVGDGDLGSRIRGETAVGAVAPQAIANAGSRAPGAAGALLGRRARDALRLEPAHAADGIEHAAPFQPRIDDDAYALDGEARLGDVRREHDLAPTRACRRSAASCSPGASSPNSGSTSTSAPRANPLVAAVATRRISPAPGRNNSRSPGASVSARSTARAASASTNSAPPGRTGKPLPV